jgi:hypothetical protein
MAVDAYDSWDLLGEILASAPKLAHASCQNLGRVFDGDDAPSRAVAQLLCRSCPALRECGAWARAQPVGRLSGVIGGELYHPTSAQASSARNSV